MLKLIIFCTAAIASICIGVMAFKLIFAVIHMKKTNCTWREALKYVGMY